MPSDYLTDYSKNNTLKEKYRSESWGGNDNFHFGVYRI